jgi:hypothetical protein
VSIFYRHAAIDFLPPSASSRVVLELEARCSRFTIWHAGLMYQSIPYYLQSDNVIDATIEFMQEGETTLITPFAPQFEVGDDLVTGSLSPGLIPKLWANGRFVYNYMTAGSSTFSAISAFYSWCPAAHSRTAGATPILGNTEEEALLWVGRYPSSVFTSGGLHGTQIIVKPYYVRTTANKIVLAIRPWRFNATATPDQSHENNYTFSLFLIRGET